MKRTIALSLATLLAFACSGASPATSATDEHATALAAVADIQAARAEIVRIEDTSLVGHPSFLHAAQRALNAVVGRDDRLYKTADGDPGDGLGAIGNVDRLLDRKDDAVWTAAAQGAKANLLAVVVNLHDAMREKQMEDYETDLTEALANFSLVMGRPSENGVLGGLSGALANTTLGIPAGAPRVSACKVPTSGPAYGVSSGGQLAYVALSRSAARAIPEHMNVNGVAMSGNAVILYTRPPDQIATLCRQAHLERTRAIRRTRTIAPVQVADNAMPAGADAASYTTTQAHAGVAIFAASCQSCHGANLQGVAAPGVAGTEFLTSAKNNKWTLADLRTLVVENMPLNNPGTLTKEQYANVMAFLLASNCYPAGTKPFPQTDSPAFANLHIGPVSGAAPSDPKLGVCAVK